jgi:hypothetical protein
MDKINRRLSYTIITVAIFGIAMAYVEAVVVVYLRRLYYPDGFNLPLKNIPDFIIRIELFRELATIIMLATVSNLASKKFWERFGYFIIIFGIWDIFYYIFLAITLGWPNSLFDWDVLFLVPYPWIGPVIAPVLVSLLMIITGSSITRLYKKGYSFKPTSSTWILSIIATGMILYSFMYDTNATLRLQPPRPYLYWLLISGSTLYIIAYLLSYFKAFQK